MVLRPDSIFPRKSERYVYFSMGLAADAANADAGEEAATMEQGPTVAASWPSPIVGLKIESVLRLSARPGALAQRLVPKNKFTSSLAG